VNHGRHGTHGKREGFSQAVWSDPQRLWRGSDRRGFPFRVFRVFRGCDSLASVFSEACALLWTTEPASQQRRESVSRRRRILPIRDLEAGNSLAIAHSAARIKNKLVTGL
jgi:hypothetical protein